MSRPKTQKEAATPQQTSGESVSILDRTRATMDKACVSLDACVDRVAAMLTGGEYDKDLASHLAWLTKQLAGVTDALRKLEAHDKTIVAKMSPEKRDELVMAYLKSVPPARQATIAQQLLTWSKPGGMLG